MPSWGNTCRVCACTGEYQVFAKIPPYLHESTNEFLNWQKPVNQMLEETTGLEITPNDGLPKKICALCISYLKHAVTFREQTITNAMNLKALHMMREKAKKIAKEKKQKDKESDLITCSELATAPEHKINSNLLTTNCRQIQDKVCKQLINHFTTLDAKPPSLDEQQHFLNLIFDKDINIMYAKRANRGYQKQAGQPVTDILSDIDEESDSTQSSDDGEATPKKESIFSYEEKNFEEDDVLALDELRDIVTYQLPENYKEHKCPACARRFMFTDSYKAHTDICVEFTLLTFIEDVNRLLVVRRKKAVSPHEYIRRVIFKLRKFCEWLNANCDTALPSIINEGSVQRRAVCNTNTAGASDETQRQINVLGFSNYSNESHGSLSDDTLTPQPSECLRLTPSNDATTGSIFATPTREPITEQNNILYEIERSESSTASPNSILEMGPAHGVEVKKPIPVLATSAVVINNLNPTEMINSPKQTLNNGQSIESYEERLLFLRKLQGAVVTQLPNDPCATQITIRRDLMPEKPPESEMIITPLKSKYIARCNACSILFQSLAALEVHNADHHNSAA